MRFGIFLSGVGGPAKAPRKIVFNCCSTLGAFMVNIQKLKPAWHDYRTDIPQWVASGIGQVAVEWAVLERELEELIRLLMDIDPQHGRIIVNWMNAKTRSVTAQHLIQVHILQDKLKPHHFETFMKVAGKIEPLQTKRDILAHGVWDIHEGHWCTLKCVSRGKLRN